MVQQQGFCSKPGSNAKMIQFYHNKGIDMLKLGCKLPILANICLHKSTNYKLCPFCENDKNLCEKKREDMSSRKYDALFCWFIIKLR